MRQQQKLQLKISNAITNYYRCILNITNEDDYSYALENRSPRGDIYG